MALFSGNLIAFSNRSHTEQSRQPASGVLSSQRALGSDEIKELPCYRYVISLQSPYSSSTIVRAFSRGDQSLLITAACLPPVTVKRKQVPYTGWWILLFL